MSGNEDVGKQIRRQNLFQKYGEMSRSRPGLAGVGEWPTLEPVLPCFEGKRVLDLGCGYDWHCLWAAQHGAARVVGLDLSEKCWRWRGGKIPLPRSDTGAAPSSRRNLGPATFL